MIGRDNSNLWKREWEILLKEKELLEKEGFRCVVIGHKVIPDIIAFKDNKIFAVEVDYKRQPNYSKYTDEIRQFYDDIIWIRLRKSREVTSMRG